MVPLMILSIIVFLRIYHPQKFTKHIYTHTPQFQKMLYESPEISGSNNGCYPCERISPRSTSLLIQQRLQLKEVT